MVDVKQVQDDLAYVRSAVNRRSPGLGVAVVAYYLSAAYVLIGYILLDLKPLYANWFFIVGAIVFWIVVAMVASRSRHRTGEIDRLRSRQAAMHWALGFVAAIASGVALECVNPHFRGLAGGQVIAVMFGMVYLMWGVYWDKSFLLLGPILIAGGVVVSLIPHFPWTSLGVVMAIGLIASAIAAQRSSARRAAA